MDKTKATVKDWFLLTRPWSAAAPLVPFLVGLGLAFGSRQIEPWGLVRWALGLTSGILLVYACNLFNTWGDERSGVDRMPGVFLTTPQIQQGKITLRQTFVFGSILFVFAGLVGLPTLFYSVSTPDAGGVRFVCDWLGLPETMRFNVPLFVGASIGFLGAVNYSTGIKYKYYGLGVPFVAFLEGSLYVFVVLALLAPRFLTHWFTILFGRHGLVGDVLPDVVLLVAASLPVASLVGVILHGNDMRDIATDRRAGIITLAGVLKPKGALVLFFALHLLPYVLLTGLFGCLLGWAACWEGWRVRDLWAVVGGLLPFLALPKTIGLLKSALHDYRANPAAPAWLDLEQDSGGVHCVFGLLYALGWAICRFAQ